MRHREFATDSITGFCRRYNYAPSGALTGTTDYTGQSHVSYARFDTMDDFVTKDFHKLRAAGKIVINPMRRGIVSCNSVPGSVTIVYHSDGSKVIIQGHTGTIVGLYSQLRNIQWHTTSVDGAWHRTTARSKAIANIGLPSHDFAEDMLEFGKTVDALKKPTADYKKAVLGIQRALQASGLQKASQLAQMASELYLSASFGHGNIIKGIIRGFDYYKTKAPIPPYRKAVGYSEERDERSGQITIHPTSSDVEVYDHARSESFEAFAYIYYRYKRYHNKMYQLCGLRLQDLPRGLWAIMPSSWFIDQMWNVSSVINGSVNLIDPDFEILGAGESSTTLITDRKEMISKSGQGVTVSITPNYLYYEEEFHSRDVWTPSTRDTVPPIPHFGKTVGRMAKIGVDVAYATTLLSKLLTGKVK